MNRLEFCNMMTDAKKNSDKTTSEITFAMKMLLPTLRRFEKGEHNFSMKKVFEYLLIIQHKMVFVSEINTNTCATYENLILWIKEQREQQYSQRKLAEIIGVSHITIANIERQSSSLTIDMFLKMIEVFGYQLKIEKL